MKNLFIALACLFTFNVFAQEQITLDDFVGTWISSDTTAQLIIIKVGEELEFTNYDPLNQDYFEEITLRQLQNEINTTFYRPENEWSLDVTYHLSNKTTLIADCFGSYYGRIYYTKL